MKIPPPQNVILAISGGIAAVKAPELVRRLVERGHSVRCIVTRNTSAFVAVVPLEVFSRHSVYAEEYLSPGHGGVEQHIDLARWGDVFCVAPATCNVLAKLALGYADDFLSTTALAFEGRFLVAPAMSGEMWRNPVLQAHVRSLQDRGVEVVGPVRGRLASGEMDEGRMVDPVEIVEVIDGSAKDLSLAGKTVLVTAGPTREPIDSVRYLSNASSGKMGFAVAKAAVERGAKVILVAGPVDLPTPLGVQRIDVVTGAEMYRAVEGRAAHVDLFVMAAAVADFRPAGTESGKIKKARAPRSILLEENEDILGALGRWAPNALRVGFAAEAGEVHREARRKLLDKDVRFIVANDISRSDIGFDSDYNEVIVFSSSGQEIPISRRSKIDLARELLDIFAKAMNEREHEFSRVSS